MSATEIGGSAIGIIDGKSSFTIGAFLGQRNIDRSTGMDTCVSGCAEVFVKDVSLVDITATEAEYIQKAIFKT